MDLNNIQSLIGGLGGGSNGGSYTDMIKDLGTILNEAFRSRNYTKNSDQLIQDYSKQPITKNYGGYQYNYTDENLSGSTLDHLKTSLGDIVKSTYNSGSAGWRLGSKFGSIGSGIVGGLGAGVGLYSSNMAAITNLFKFLDERKKALRKIHVDNLTSMSNATDAYNTDMFNTRYKTDNSNIFYNNAYNGKDACKGFFRGKDVFTAAGVMPSVKNANVSKGEYIWDGVHYPQYVNKGPNDTAPAFLRGKDVVFTNNPEIPAPTGFKTIAQAVPYALRTGQLGALAKWQEDMHNAGYKNGKDPGYAWGKDDLEDLGILASQLFTINRQYKKAGEPIKNVDVRTKNKYEKYLTDLRNLRVDNRPVIDNILQAERSAWNDIKLSGGMTGSEKRKARQSLMLNTQKNIATANMNGQIANNQLLADAYKTALNIGNYNAERNMKGNITNEQFLSNANARQFAGYQTADNNLTRALQDYRSNRFKKNQFEEMLDLYRQKLSQDQLNYLSDQGYKFPLLQRFTPAKIFTTYTQPTFNIPTLNYDIRR